MLDAYIQKIKVYCAILCAILLAVVGLGSFVLKESDFVRDDVIPSTASYLIHATEFHKGALLLSPFKKVSRIFDNSLTYAAPSENTKAVPVLVYHGILRKSDGSTINSTVENFKNQMFALKRAGYETITSAELLSYLKGERQLPPKSVMVTFDDGRTDSVYYADPIFKVLGYKGVMFAVTHYSLELNNGYYISASDIERMLANGRWDVQAHSHMGHESRAIDPYGGMGHFFSHKLWLQEENRLETDDEFKKRTVEDMRQAKARLEHTFKTPIIAFAIPFGDYGQNFTNFPRAESVIKENVQNVYPLVFYQSAPKQRFTSNYHLKKAEGDASYFIKRIDVDVNSSGEALVAMLEKSAAKELPYTDTFESNKGWIHAWGDVEIEGGRLIMKAVEHDSGAATMLDGTRRWRDYRLEAVVEAPKQNGIYVWVRFQDDDNNAACNLGGGFAHVEQTVNGNKRVIKGFRGENLSVPAGPFTVGVEVKDRTVKCLVNGEIVVETPFLEESLEEGGVGFKTWDSSLGHSILVIDTLEVLPL